MEKPICNSGSALELINRLENQIEYCCDCLPGNNQRNEIMLPCNEEQASGGDGKTENRHGLGNSAGTVTISYNMENQPDMIEIFYEGKLVASSQTIPGNVNGFVGAGNGAGCCGSIQFYYPAREKFCVVRITGDQLRSGTRWTYTLGCPDLNNIRQ
jgi:hypothetical protein